MTTTTGAEDVHWDLTHLYSQLKGRETNLELVAAKQMSEGFASRLRGHLMELDAVLLADAIEELQAIQEKVEKAQTFAYLNFATDSRVPQRGAFLQHVEEEAAVVSTNLLFFELEWAAMPEEHVEELLADPAME